MTVCRYVSSKHCIWCPKISHGVSIYVMEISKGYKAWLFSPKELFVKHLPVCCWLGVCHLAKVGKSGPLTTGKQYREAVADTLFSSVVCLCLSKTLFSSSKSVHGISLDSLVMLIAQEQGMGKGMVSATVVIH